MTHQEQIKKFNDAIFSIIYRVKKTMLKSSGLCGGLNEKDMLAVSIVSQKGNLKMRELANEIECPMSTLTSIVDKLVEQQFLTRFHSKEDRRVVMVTLGSKGKEAEKIYQTEMGAMAADMLSNLNSKEQDTLVELLHKVTPQEKK